MQLLLSNENTSFNTIHIARSSVSQMTLSKKRIYFKYYLWNKVKKAYPSNTTLPTDEGQRSTHASTLSHPQQRGETYQY